MWSEGSREKHYRNLCQIDGRIVLAGEHASYIPAWMEGASLLREDPPARRPIFCVATDSSAVNPRKWRVFENQTVPPFYSLGVLAVSFGDRAYSLDLKTGALTQKRLAGHTRPLADDEAPSEAEARQILLKHLEDQGYEVPDALRSGGG